MAGVIPSAVDVRRGDPLADVAVALRMQPVYEATQAAAPLTRLVAIHGDLSIIGPVDEVFKAFRFFQQQQINDKDFQLQTEKSHGLIPHQQDAKSQHQQHITQQAQVYGLPITYGAISLLGGCVRSDVGKMTCHVRDKLEALKPLFEALQHPVMPSQTAYHILRINTEPGYLARISRPNLPSDVFRVFDESVLKHLSRSPTLSLRSSDCLHRQHHIESCLWRFCDCTQHVCQPNKSYTVTEPPTRSHSTGRETYIRQHDREISNRKRNQPSKTL